MISGTPAERSRRILDGAHFTTLATASAGGEPWSSVVHYVWAGDPLRLFFCSPVGTLHGRNIDENPQLSGSIVLTGIPSDNPLATVDGAQFAGRCAEVAEAELPERHDHFFRTMFPDEELRRQWMLPLDQLSGSGTHRLYEIRVARWWLVDLSTWEEDRVDRRAEVPVESFTGEHVPAPAPAAG